MRRRNHLQVNTFPFLAVLLCAMGALILILLIMDRRSRIAAQARGRDQVERITSEHDLVLAARKREQAQRQEAVLSAWDKKRAALKARLDAEQQSLDAELRQVQARLAEIARGLRTGGEAVGQLRHNLQAEQTRLTRQEQALQTARKESTTLKTTLTTADRARNKLTADLGTLEQVIRDLQSARKRDAMTYSVIPYKGKSGENRRPLYVECNATGLLFHPDRFQLIDPSPPSLHEEIARRVKQAAEKRKAAGLNEERPYLMMLIRPKGIRWYYQVQSAIYDMPIEFGYEFVDADWVLTIPTEDVQHAAAHEPASSKVEPTRTGMPRSAGPAATLDRVVISTAPRSDDGTSGIAQGTASTGTTGGPDLMGNSTGNRGGSAGGFLNGAANDGLGTGSVSANSGGLGHGSTGPALTPGIGLNPPQPIAPGSSGSTPASSGGSGPAPELVLLPPGSGSGRVNAPNPDAPLNGNGKSGVSSEVVVLSPGPGPGSGGGIAPNANPHPPIPGEPLPPLSNDWKPGKEATPISIPQVLPGSVTAKAGASNGPSGSGSTGGASYRPSGGLTLEGPPIPGARPRNLPLLPARVSGADDTTVFVECLSDGVVVHPAGRSIGIDALNHSPAHNPLYQTVMARLALHRGDLNRRHIRFLVHRDAERTYHLAYPAFNGILVDKSRYTLLPDDDVSRIVASD